MYSDSEKGSAWARICRGAWQYCVVGPVRVPIGHNLQQRAIVVYVVVHFVFYEMVIRMVMMLVMAMMLMI